MLPQVYGKHNLAIRENRASALLSIAPFLFDDSSKFVRVFWLSLLKSVLKTGGIAAVFAFTGLQLFLFKRRAMIRSQQNVKKQRVAVIGGGIAGCGSAFALSTAENVEHVTLYERKKDLGGNGKTYLWEKENIRTGLSVLVRHCSSIFLFFLNLFYFRLGRITFFTHIIAC